MTAAHDKHNHPIHVGDVVELVYGGEHHTLVVESLSEHQGHHFVHGPINVQAPTTACSRRKDENPKTAPRDQSKAVRVTEHKK